MEYGYQEAPTGFEGVREDSTLRVLANAHPSAQVSAAAHEELRRREWKARVNAPTAYDRAMEREHAR